MRFTNQIFKELFVIGNRYKFPKILLRLFDFYSPDGENDREYQREIEKEGK